MSATKNLLLTIGFVLAAGLVAGLQLSGVTPHWTALIVAFLSVCSWLVPDFISRRINGRNRGRSPTSR